MRYVLALLLVYNAGACNSAREKRKRAAKERFLSGKVSAPVERLRKPDVSKIGRDPAETERALLTPASVVAKQLGSFRFEATTDYRARELPPPAKKTKPAKAKPAKKRSRRRRRRRRRRPVPRAVVRLKETLRWDQAQGGNFYTLVRNSRSDGVETWWVDKRFFLRRRWGKVRQRPVEEREFLEYPRSVWSSWSAAYRLFEGRIQLTEQGSARVGGRPGRKFAIGLAAQPLTDIAKRTPRHPAQVEAADLKVATARRVLWRRAAEPLEASGDIVLDSETGIPLRVRFAGKLRFTTASEAGEIQIKVSTRMEKIGSSVAIAKPEKFVEEPVIRKIDSDRFSLIDMVRIEDFLIDRYEFPNEKGATPRSGLSARQARNACRKVGKRLCTRKEWMKACNSDRRRNRYPYGRFYRAGHCNSEGSAALASGGRKQCRGEFRVYDLVGNVSEWVKRKEKNRWVYCLAGGSFHDKRRAVCRRCISSRKAGRPDGRFGVRCCK